MEILHTNEKTKIIQLLKNNKIIAMPTDTVYGFSCLATCEETIENLYQLKQRDNTKQFILLVSENFDLNSLLKISSKTLNFIKNNTPNPLTIIVEKNKNAKLAPQFSLDTLAIRIPNDKFLQSILNEVGYMISTSCNINNQPLINNWQDIKSQFPLLDAIVVSESNNNLLPSTIIDATSTPFKILRQGDYIVKN